MIKVLIVDDQELFRESLKVVLVRPDQIKFMERLRQETIADAQK